jgi:M6 family metalloprotease-like protein
LNYRQSELKLRDKKGDLMLLLLLIANYWFMPHKNYDLYREQRLLPNFYQKEARVQSVFSRFRLTNPEFHPQLQKVKKYAKFRKDKQQIVMRVLALRVEFEEENPDDPRTTGNGIFRNNSNGQDPILGLDCNGRPYYNPYYDPPHDWSYFNNQMRALASYVYAATYGKVRLEWIVKPDSGLPPYKVPHLISYYGDPNNMELGLVTFVRDAFRSADEDPSISFEDLDRNGVKDYLEGVWVRYIIFHAGSAWQTDILGDSPYDLAAVTIPPGALEYYLGRGYLVLNGGVDTVYDACILPETMSQDGLEIKLQGTLFHESGHNLFLLPDLYDTYGRGAGIGAFGIMTTGPYLEAEGVPSGIIPPLPNAWERTFMDFILKVIYGEGFLDNNVVVTIEPGQVFQEVSLYPIQIPVDSFVMEKRRSGLYYVYGNFLENPYSKPRIAKIPINSKEYFLIQNLETNIGSNDFVNCGDTIKVSGRWSNGVVVDFRGENDYLLPGDGLLVFHIDDQIIWNNYATNTVNAVRPMGVYILEADHVQDFQRFNWDFTPYSYCWFGSPYDLYFEGNNTLISSTTLPSSVDNQGNKTYIEIFGISPKGYEMKFKVRLEKNLPPFPVRIGYSVVDSNSSRMIIDEPHESYLEGKDTLLIALQNVYRKSINLSTYDTTLVDSFGLVSVVNYSGLVILIDTLKNTLFIKEPAIGDINDDGYLDFLCAADKRRLILYTTKDADGNGRPDMLFSKVLPEEIVSVPSFFTFNGQKVLGVGLLDNKYYILRSNGDSLFVLNTGAPAHNIPATNGSILFYQSVDGRLLILTDRFDVYTVGTSNLTSSACSPVLVYDSTSGGYRVISVNGLGYLTIYNERGATINTRKIAEKPLHGIAIGDIDADGNEDIVYVTEKYLVATNKELATISKFPVRIDSTTTFQPLLADVDGDGFEEIILPTEKGINLYGYLQSDSLNYYPVSKGLNSSPFIEDINKDNKPELMYITADGYIYAYPLPTLRSSWRHYGYTSEHNPFISLPTEANLPPAENELVSLIYVYPNPVFVPYITFRFKAQKGGKVDVKIYDFSGKKVKEASFVFNGEVVEEKTIYVGDLGTDIYTLKAIFDINGKSVTKKIRFIVGKKKE